MAFFCCSGYTHPPAQVFSAVGSSGGPHASCCYCLRGEVSATPACFPMDVFGTNVLAPHQRNDAKEKNKERRSCETVIQAANPNKFPQRFPIEIFSLSDSSTLQAGGILLSCSRQKCQSVWAIKPKLPQMVSDLDSWLVNAEVSLLQSQELWPFIPSPSPLEHNTSCHQRPNVMISVQAHKHVLLTSLATC